MKQTKGIVARIFPWVFILTGLFAAGCGVKMMVQSIRCESWPSTEGVILTSQMKSHSGDEGGTTYSASICYDYKVSDVHYTSTRWAIGAMSSSSSYAQEILSRYPAGKKVTVYHSPDEPKEAVLETGIHGGTWICLAVGTVFVLAGCMILQLFRKALATDNSTDYIPGVQSAKPGASKPPLLMGIIFVVMGSFVFFMRPSGGTPGWIAYCAGGMFVLAGLGLMATHLQNQLLSKIFFTGTMLAFVTIFHWVSFGEGLRDIDYVLGAFTILMDLILLAFFVKWLRNLSRG